MDEGTDGRTDEQIDGLKDGLINEWSSKWGINLKKKTTYSRAKNE